jgi:hypothetical protein
VKLALLSMLLVGYVMPSSSILRRLTGKRDDLTIASGKLQGNASVAPILARTMAPALGAPWTNGELPLVMTLSVQLPGRCRIDLTAPESAKTMSAVWSNGKVRLEGPEFPALQVAVEQFCATLAMHSSADGESRAALERHLSGMKVETRKVSFGRFAGTVAYILGNPAENSPQFWVYKDQYLPARVRLTNATGSWDVRFIDYTSQASGEWFPRIVEVYKGSELHLRMTAMNSSWPANLASVKF